MDVFRFRVKISPLGPNFFSTAREKIVGDYEVLNEEKTDFCLLGGEMEFTIWGFNHP